MRELLLGLGLCLATPAPAALADDDPATLVGQYELVGGEEDGKALPKDRLNGVVRITADTITSYDRDNKELYVAKYQIRRDTNPWTITMAVAGGPDVGRGPSTAAGVIKLEGETLTLCYAPEGKDAPRDFKTRPDSGQNLFLMKKTGR